MIDAFTIPQVYAAPHMHDKPTPAPIHEHPLAHYSVLALNGRDSFSFAQAQFMNDVSRLEDGQWQWNGWLNAKGRVIALFALLRIDAETLWLLLPDHPAAALAEQLRRFVFRSKVQLSARDDLAVAGQCAPPLHAQGHHAAMRDGEVELDFSADAGPRRVRIRPAQAAEASLGVDDGADDGDDAYWASFDLRHGLPRLPVSQSEQWTPQQLSLERLAAFSVKKGCYPGQEIVARTHFLGQAKRGAVLLHAALPLAVGDAISDGQQVLGTVVASAGAWALAVLPLQLNETPLFANGHPVQAAPIGAGLAR
jgi:hypothetical protein